LRLYLNISFANFVTACAIESTSSGCVTGDVERTCSVGPAPVSALDAERIELRAERGRRWRGLLSLQRLWSRRVHVCHDCQLATRLSRFGFLARPRAFFAGPGNVFVDGERCPCGFRTLNGSVICPRSPRSVGRDLDLVLSRVSGELSREHVAGLARDTHLWFLFEPDERMA
jgi:hypothetical protein